MQQEPTVAWDDTIAGEADVSKQLVVVDLAVGQPLLLVVARSEKRFLTLGAHEMLHMPRLAQRVHHALLYRASGGG